METVFTLTGTTPDLHCGSCVTIGNFDGVHRGHQLLINRMIEQARACSLPAVLVTFSPHPLQVLCKASSLSQLTSMEERLAIFAQLGVDLAVVLRFTPEMAVLPPRQFCLETLVNQLHVRHLFVGYDFSLGKGKSGDYALLTEIGRDLGFSVEQCSPLAAAGEIISSSRIRTLVGEGNMTDLPALMGRHYSVAGPVTHGMGRGSTLLGFPTANVATETLLPADGVYAVGCRLDGKPGCPEPACLRGVASIGTNPTFGNNAPTLEVHLLDFSADIYGKKLCVTFYERLRGMQTFSGPSELVAQIRQDIALAAPVFKREGL